MTTAYLRVSTSKQHVENQKKEIQQFANRRGLTIHQWRDETISGTIHRKRRRLGELIDSLQQGDILIVSEISRLSRTMLEIMTIFNACAEKGIVFYSIKEGYNFDNTMNSKIIGFAFGLAAEIERNLISARTREALAHKKAAGVKLGRPHGLCPQTDRLKHHREDIARRMAGKETISSIARHYGVSRNTLYAFLKNGTAGPG